MNFDEIYIKKLLPVRPKESHKGTFGHVLNIAGSKFYTGASYFSSISALKVGCGLVTLSSSDTVLNTVAVLTPDLIFCPLSKLKEKILSKSYNVISVGCGLSVSKQTIKLFVDLLNILNEISIPLIIDADGLNILSDCKNINLPINTVLTPHPKELSRLMGINVEYILSQPEFWVKKCCEKYNCITVLKLHKTLISDNNDNFYQNTTGNSALSHAGSGDVLCGIISGFLAQGMNCFEASLVGVYVHGKAAEIASMELSEYSVLASDLIKYIPNAIRTIL
jgi:hydroxyethylthiazole kinase-like uncharacterized protein yjeF